MRGPNSEPNDSLRVRELFEALVDLAPDERRAHLDALTLPDDVRKQLQALLDADLNPQPLLSLAAADVVDRLSVDSDLVRGLIGSKIGSFRLLALIGEGGSSAVFRAERAAGSGAQTVALKLLRTGLFSADGQRRFRREQAILAQLTHPNIAHLIEGGISDAGIPYIAMEYVDGQPITEDADARALNLADRLRLFATLCRVIDAAHGALVVHRDLKPSNVFVTRDGELKVLDFGIAKLLDEDVGTTRTQSIMLTPGYAAPEQYGVGSVTVVVDVYALGVLLGELLTGKRLGGSATTRASACVLGAEGASTLPGLLPREPLARQLRGDLDAIIANAIAEEPALRYRSAAALADDIEGYLEHRPVRAHPPSRWYRTRKFAVRHRGGVVITALFVVGILASLALAVWQESIARSAAIAARAQAARANSMRDFMFDAFSETEPGAPGAGATTVVEAVERAISTVSTDPGADPSARIELLIHLAQVLGAQGQLDRATSLLATTQAYASKLLGANHLLTLEAEQVSIAIAVLHTDYREARSRIDELMPRLPADAIDLKIDLLRNSATVAGKQHDRERALRESRLALQLSRDTGDTEKLRLGLRNLGSVLLDFDEVREAVGIYEELLALARARYGDVHAIVSAEQAALSRAYRRSGDVDRAEAHARAAVEIDRKVYAGDHWHVGLHLNALTMLLIQRRKFDEALSTETESLRIERATRGEQTLDALMALSNIGFIHIAREDYASALPPLRQALDGAVAKYGAEYFTSIRIRMTYGYALAMSGQRRSGEAELDQAIAAAAARTEPDAELLAMALERRIRIALEFSDTNTALALIERMRAPASVVAGKASWQGRVDTLRGEALLGLGRNQEAIVALDAAAAELQHSADPDAVFKVANPLLRAAAAQAIGDIEHARSLAVQAKTLLSALPYPPSRLTRLAASLPG